VNSRGTPYHFRFSVSSDVFRDPTTFGRPAGVFNADCWGKTPQDPNETRMKVKLAEAPNTASRFPLAKAFTSREEAAIECDFWKLVLRRRFFLDIPWTHGTREAFLEAASFAQRDVMAELDNESSWSHELLDFVNEHQSLLLKNRDAKKPELDLEEWEREAKRLPSRALFTWVQQVRAAQRELEMLPDATRLQAIVNGLSALRKYRPLDYNPRVTKFSKSLGEVNSGLVSLANYAKMCENLFLDLEDHRRNMKSALRSIVAARPPAVPDTDTSDKPLHYQSNVS